MFFCSLSSIFRSDAVFLKHEKPYSWFIEDWRWKCYYFVGFSYYSGNTRFCAGDFSRIPFNISMENHVHWWSPRARNNGNLFAKVTILGFFVFPTVRTLVKSEKIVKAQYCILAGM